MYGVAAVADEVDPSMGQLVIITEVGKMNVLQLYQEQCIPLHVTYDLWARLAAAVYTIHTKKIIHRDLKPENILVMGVSVNFTVNGTFSSQMFFCNNFVILDAIKHSIVCSMNIYQ